jgi:predicted RNA-binding protein YlqC (UPF0109 family)
VTEVEDVTTLLHGVINAMVDRPESVVLTSDENGSDITFRVTVHPEDLGKLIGKQGRNARSIRTILSAISMTKKLRFTLDISDRSGELG